MKKIALFILSFASLKASAQTPTIINRSADLISMQGGGSGGTPPAQENGGVFPGVVEKPKSEDLLSGIRAEDLFRELNGKIQIPTTADNIRRLKVRISVTGTAPLMLMNGERFLLERDPAEDKLVDVIRAAEVIKKTQDKISE